MVNDQPVIELRTRWFPTRASGERSMLMQLEFAVNQPGNQGESSMAELTWSTGDVQKALADLPPIVPPPVRRELKVLLQPWSQGRYIEAYRRSGGILNLFTPPWGENQDEVWNKLLAEWKAKTYLDDRSRGATLAALEQHSNSPEFLARMGNHSVAIADHQYGSEDK